MSDQTLVNLALLEQVTSIFTAEIRKLSARIKMLEQRRLMAFEGAHDPGKSYASGDCVQRGGALHVALVATSETPGASSSWRQISQAKP